jgi:ribosomal protein S18 acetylase RimI-like enzyme
VDAILADRAVMLRAATPDDEPFLRRLYATTRARELALVPWTDDQKTAFVEMQFAAQHRHYHEHYHDTTFDVVILEAEASGLDAAPIGRLYVARWTSEIRIVDIAILPEFCNRGVGTRLLRELQDEARASAKPLRIHVEHFNPARRLYDRLGFQEIETNGVYHLMEWGGL